MKGILLGLLVAGMPIGALSIYNYGILAASFAALVAVLHDDFPL
jgi:hypothetical protein